MDEWFAQHPHGVRFDWVLAGAAALAPSSACLVIVDILSFTTSVTVAVEAGTRVFTYAWRDETAVGFARQHQARLAADHRTASADSPWSLSPAALRRAPFTARLVLPSPNGSAISAAAADSGATVIAACLRNMNAVGRWLAEHGFGTPQQPVTVIAAGERWPDGNLRPALEDLLGVGAVIAAISEHSRGVLSAEADAARACFEGTSDLASAVTDSASGRELAERGFPDDVAIATEINSCRVVPLLTDHAFTATS
jgi:2-phosphosulfolactate phosphatase